MLALCRPKSLPVACCSALLAGGLWADDLWDVVRQLINVHVINSHAFEYCRQLLLENAECRTSWYGLVPTAHHQRVPIRINQQRNWWTNTIISMQTSPTVVECYKGREQQKVAFLRAKLSLSLRCHGDALKHARTASCTPSIVFCPQPRVLLVWVRVPSSGNLPKCYQSSVPSAVSVSVNTTIHGSAWPSGRLYSDYMAEVSETAASDPVHNVMLDVELIPDVWCLYFWRERFLTHQGFSGDNPTRILIAYSYVSLSASRFQSCRSKFLSPWSTFVSVLRSLLFQLVANLFIPSQTSPILL